MPAASPDNPLDSPNPADQSPFPELIGGRYRVLRSLKCGSEGHSLLAFDPTLDRQVVIKKVLANAFSATVRMRLEHEANVLTQIKTGHLPPLLEFNFTSERVYLVSPFVAGVSLQERLRQGPLGVSETIALGRTVLMALGAAHARDVLHRAVKPSNIIVNDGLEIRETTLIDFGLARGANLDPAIRDQWAGTAQYLSPESAGLLDQDVTSCSDLYSTGIVLFECLAGHPPFQGGNVGEVLRQHMTLQPPELRSLGLAVPRVLDEVVQRLLRKDPRDRYQSAQAAAADLAVIADALAQGESEPSFVVGLHDRRRTLTEPAFVGRGQELATLAAQLNRTQNGPGGLVLLEAESGGGKTRLLSEFALHGARQGAWILRGQGLDQAAQRPFQMFTGVAEGLLATARLEPGVEKKILTALGDHTEGVC